MGQHRNYVQNNSIDSITQSRAIQSGEKGAEQETMDYLEFIARVTSHIPDKGQVMVRWPQSRVVSSSSRYGHSPGRDQPLGLVMGAGTLFGLTIVPGNKGIYYADDGENSLKILY